MPRPRLQVMISSTVYGFEDQLEQIAATLTTYKYDVLMSHMGTIPPIPHAGNRAACLRAVDACHYFVGIIRGQYGSGQGTASGLADHEVSITHHEQRRAIHLDKPRLFLVEQKVAEARQVLKPILGHFRADPLDPNGVPQWDLPLAPGEQNPFRGNGVLTDLRVLAMYEEALLSEQDPAARHDHWCQPFYRIADILRLLEARFKDRKRLREELEAALRPSTPPAP